MKRAVGVERTGAFGDRESAALPVPDARLGEIVRIGRNQTDALRPERPERIAHGARRGDEGIAAGGFDAPDQRVLVVLAREVRCARAAERDRRDRGVGELIER